MNLKLGNCLDILKECADNSVDSIVTDPPYGLSFMSKKWDYDVPSVELWTECLRVLKPGGHLLAFGGTRTYHRLVVAIEAAGFEIRDQIQWLYGSGFPKSLDISKAIDKAAGTEREVIGVAGKSGAKRNAMAGDFAGGEYMKTAPATTAAKQWSGWGSALKPANEPICLARKPLSESTIAKNVLKHGTGGLNIDGSRIEADDLAASLKNWDRTQSSANGDDVYKNGMKAIDLSDRAPSGRFPSNVILDEDAAKVLDEQSLGVSRFFYIPKVSSKERGESTHPTMKPIKLMEYLVKLVTPEGGIVLDPFMGSGTTGVAAKRLGFDFLGIELDPGYFEIASKRINGSVLDKQTNFFEWKELANENQNID